MTRFVMATLALSLSLATLGQAIQCNDSLIRGVNLGGLFLLEPWITPTIFEEVNEDLGHIVVDEYTYAQYVNKSFAEQRLNRHWDEFYSRQDLELLYSTGISHVRVPIGYWLVDVSADEPFPPPPATDNDGQRFYLKRLLGWCNEIGLKVLIDLHGAPESQNGFDNSGRRGPVNWVPEEGASHPYPSVQRTLVILDKLADLFMSWVADGTMSQETFWGLEILNEPAGWGPNLWTECRDYFYPDAYDLLRPKLPNQRIYIQQAFRDPTEFIGLDTEGLGLDLHNYHAFGEYWNDLAADPSGWDVNLAAACDYAALTSQLSLETVVGEWSLAVCDCQKYLDGGYANPYVPPNALPSTCEFYNGDFENYPDYQKDFMRDYMAAQMDAGEAGDGWFFWTAKTENNCAPEWDYLFLVQNGIAPQNLCERPRYC